MNIERSWYTFIQLRIWTLITVIEFNFNKKLKIAWDKFLEINLKTEKEKIILIKNLSTNVLEFDYPKNLTLGVDQYYNFECGIKKIDDSLEVDNITLKFSLNNENEDFMYKSVANIPSKKII